MLTKDLLRVSRAGGGYRPEFVGNDPDVRDLAARVLGVYQGHVGESRGRLEEALTDLEREAEDFKLVRGLAKLLERDATFETRSPIPPERARRVAFEAAEAVGVVTEEERRRALARAGDRLDADPAAVERSLYADLPERQELVAFDPRWDPDELVAQYDLSLAQTALFDATELRVRSSDPKRLVSAVKRLGLMYEIELPEGVGPEAGATEFALADLAPGAGAHPGSGDDGTGTGTDRDGGASGGESSRSPSRRELVVTGPDALFRSTRRYGTAFARLLRTLVDADAWELAATVDDRGTERTMRLDDGDPLAVPGTDPVAGVGYDSGVEESFATRFSALDLDWDLVREPDVLAAGTRAMVPDFAFDYRYEEFRVYFEIVGFWTPEYVEKKLAQLEAVDAVELLVAVDADLGVGEDVAARDHRVIEYDRRLGVKPVRDALRTYESDLVAAGRERLPDRLRPDDDVLTLEALAERHGVSVAAVEDRPTPEHRRIGRTLVRPAVLDAAGEGIAPGDSLAEAEAVLDRHGIDDASAALSALGYRVEWEGLTGGTIRERED